MSSDETLVDAAGRQVRVSSPGKVVFPRQGWTKLDLVEHYLRCAEGAVRGVFHRPTSLKRWPNGVGEEFFFTKRAPGTITHTHGVKFPSARPGNMPYVEDIADIVEQVPAGSKLLEVPDLHDVLQGFDDTALTYRWQHPDGRVDRLCDDALQVVQSGEAEGASRRDIVTRLWDAAHKAAALPTPSVPEPAVAPPRGPIPYLNEPWYC